MPARLPRRIWIYQQICPERVTAEVRSALSVALVPGLLVGLPLSGAIEGPGPAGAITVIVVIATAALAVLIAAAVRLYRLDQRLNQPLPELPALASSPLLTLSWSTAADADDLRASVDDEVVRANGWTGAEIGRNGLVLEIPAQAAANYLWTACDPVTGAFVGSTSIGTDPCDPQVGSIGMWLAPAWRGRGLGAELFRLAVLSTATAYRWPISAATSTDNVAMRRAIERAGGTELQRYDHHLPDGTVAHAIRYGFARQQPT